MILSTYFERSCREKEHILTLTAISNILVLGILKSNHHNY